MQQIDDLLDTMGPLVAKPTAKIICVYSVRIPTCRTNRVDRDRKSAGNPAGVRETDRMVNAVRGGPTTDHADRPDVVHPGRPGMRNTSGTPQAHPGRLWAGSGRAPSDQVRAMASALAGMLTELLAAHHAAAAKRNWRPAFRSSPTPLRRITLPCGCNPFSREAAVAVDC